MEAIGVIIFGVFFVRSICFAGQLKKEIDRAEHEKHKNNVKIMQEQINEDFMRAGKFKPEFQDAMVAEFEKRYDREYGLASLPKELVSRDFYKSMLYFVFYMSPLFIAFGVVFVLTLLFGDETGTLASIAGAVALILYSIFGFLLFYFVYCPICANITDKPGMKKWLQDWLLFKRK